MFNRKVKDKDKLWIIFYVGVGGINPEEIPQFIENFNQDINKTYDDTVKTIIIPTNETQTRVQFYHW